MMFSTTVSPRNSAGAWNVRASPSRGILYGATFVRSASAKRMWPVVGR